MRAMKMQKKFGITLSVALMLATGGAALAQPIIDGKNALSEYGAALYINTTDPTQFGDNDNPDCAWTSGSEIDGVYGLVQDGVLYLMVTGNMESNWNKIEFFFKIGYCFLKGPFLISIEFCGIVVVIANFKHIGCALIVSYC